MNETNSNVGSLALNNEDKIYLKDLVQWSISTYFAGSIELDELSVPKPENPLLEEELGAFVTLTKNGSLRGCIGNVIGQGQLYLTIARMARAAAFEDPRFPQVTETEFTDVSVEISIMGALSLCPDPDQIEIGKHGLIMQRGHNSGLLLPQVPVEWQWDKKTFLEQTCIKAGLRPNMWADPATKIYWFEAYVF